MITPRKMYFSIKEYYLQNKTLDPSSFHPESVLTSWNKGAEPHDFGCYEIRNSVSGRNAEPRVMPWASRAMILENKVGTLPAEFHRTGPGM